jgi:hypothetical protein
MASDRLPDDLATASVEGSVQGQRAVPVVPKAVPRCPTRGQRKNGIQSIQRLNVGFLVQAEDRGMARWIEIQTDDVRGLSLEVGIVRCRGELVGDPVGTSRSRWRRRSIRKASRWWRVSGRVQGSSHIDWSATCGLEDLGAGEHKSLRSIDLGEGQQALLALRASRRHGRRDSCCCSSCRAVPSYQRLGFARFQVK